MNNTTAISPFDEVIDRRDSHASKWQKYAGSDILPFWVADMDFAAPPFILDAIRQRLEHPILGYTRTPAELSAAFLAWLERNHGWRVPEHWLVWLPGVVTGFNLAAQAVAEPGGAIMIPTPIYYPFLDTPRNAKQHGIHVALVKDGNRWVMDFDAMEAACTPQTRLLMLCNPQNPTGRAYSVAELQALADFCISHDLYLCSDEIHCSLILDPAVSHTPVASLGPDIQKRTITLFAATKTYNIRGLSCAVAVIPDAKLRRSFRDARVGLVPGVGPITFAAATAAFADTSGWVEELRGYLRTNHDLLKAVAGERMTPVEATYLAWLDLRDLGLAQPAAALEAYGLGLSEGAQFAGPGYVRFNFGCPRATLEAGLTRLDTALKKLQEKKG
jgi:cystathionine beta-lyase